MTYINNGSRPPENPEYKTGLNSGRKQRQQDKKVGIYPRAGLPMPRLVRSPKWIEAYQAAYYQTKPNGRPMLGSALRVTFSVTAERSLIDKIDAAGISRAAAFEAGCKALLGM